MLDQPEREAESKPENKKTRQERDRKEREENCKGKVAPETDCLIAGEKKGGKEADNWFYLASLNSIL